MRTEKRSYQVYSFSELSKGAQQKAIEQFRDINVDHDWWESTIDNATEKLKEMGYDDAEINFSGFSSQGDGACFTAGVNLRKWISAQSTAVQKRYKELDHDDILDNLDISINHEGRYHHEFGMFVSMYDNHNVVLNDSEDKIIADLEITLLNDAQDEAKNIYRALEKEYYYRTSDETIIETIKVNDYEFEKNGKFFTL